MTNFSFFSLSLSLSLLEEETSQRVNEKFLPYNNCVSYSLSTVIYFPALPPTIVDDEYFLITTLILGNNPPPSLCISVICIPAEQRSFPI